VIETIRAACCCALATSARADYRISRLSHQLSRRTQADFVRRLQLLEIEMALTAGRVS